MSYSEKLNLEVGDIRTQAELARRKKELLEFFKDVLPKIIVEHNLYETETQKMTTSDVASFIYEKIDLTGKVIGEYASASFFTQATSKDDK